MSYRKRLTIDVSGTWFVFVRVVRDRGGRGCRVEQSSREALSLLPYTELIDKEAAVIGVSDHLASELPSLMRYAQNGKLTFPEAALRFVDFDAAQINAALDALERSTDHIRTVIAAGT